MWVTISIYGTFVGSPQEDFSNDLESWTHIISTLTKKLESSTSIISTLISSTLILHPHIGIGQFHAIASMCNILLV
jgi:hypothetical protein